MSFLPFEGIRNRLKQRDLFYDPATKEAKHALEAAHRTHADPEVIDSLKKVLLYAELRNNHVSNFTTPESEVCKQIVDLTLNHPWADLHEKNITIGNLSPLLPSGHVQGQFLKSLISAQNAKRVLDVGMYTGYSAMAMAEALPADGVVVSIDIDLYLKELNERTFAKSPHGSKIKIRIGNGVDVMKRLSEEGEQFDFIFLDAEKTEYISYLKLAIDGNLLAKHGTLAVDNAFMAGRAYLPLDPGVPPDPLTEFAEYVSANERLHSVLVPIRDGVFLIRRKTEVEVDQATSRGS